MAGSNVAVNLTLAGDASKLTKAFEDAGDAAEDMAKTVDDSVKKAGEAGSGFDAATEGFDKAEQRAMGFRDTITGVQDTVKGFSSILKGDFSADALLTAGAGIGDLASGFSNFLVPAIQKAWGWIKNLTIVQAALNFVMSLNPITLIVLAILALIAVFVILWNKSEAFRNFWKTLWEKLKGAAEAVGKWFTETLWPWIRDVWDNIVSKAQGVVDWFKGLPGKISSAVSGAWDGLKDAFKSAINWIIDKWNNFKITIPSVTIFGQKIGGWTLDTPDIPRLHKGGIVPGAPGQEVMAVLQAGERVIPANRSSGDQRFVLELRSSGRKQDDLLLQMLAHALKGQGLQVVTR